MASVCLARKLGHVVAILLFFASALSNSSRFALAGQGTFHRGDTNDDGFLDLTDGTFVFNSLFLAGPSLPCREAADANNDAEVDLTDGIYLLNFLFLGGPAPASPGGVTEACGPDPDPPGSPGDLGCEEYTHCETEGPATEEFEALVGTFDTLSTVAGKGEFRAGAFNGWDPTFEGGPATSAELSRPHSMWTETSSSPRTTSDTFARSRDASLEFGHSPGLVEGVSPKAPLSSSLAFFARGYG